MVDILKNDLLSARQALADRIINQHVDACVFSPRMTSVGWVKFLSMSHVIVWRCMAASISGMTRAFEHPRLRRLRQAVEPARRQLEHSLDKQPGCLDGVTGLGRRDSRTNRLGPVFARAFPPSLSAGSTGMSAGSYTVRLRTSDRFFNAAVVATAPP